MGSVVLGTVARSGQWKCCCICVMEMHTPTPSGTFRQTLPQLVMPLNGEFISVHVTTDAVSALPRVWVLITLRASLSGTKDVINQCLECGY